MEFYMIAVGAFYSNVSFNSQRDGILPQEKGLINFCFLVSIPNGMEFYEEIDKSRRDVISFQFPTGWNSTVSKTGLSLGDESFNSQRDGILLGRKEAKRKQQQVSIPNGMEFYLTNEEYPGANYEFQFPTGWNSTVPVMLAICVITTFQFPTGWNSTIAYLL